MHMIHFLLAFSLAYNSNGYLNNENDKLSLGSKLQKEIKTNISGYYIIDVSVDNAVFIDDKIYHDNTIIVVMSRKVMLTGETTKNLVSFQNVNMTINIGDLRINRDNSFIVSNSSIKIIFEGSNNLIAVNNSGGLNCVNGSEISFTGIDNGSFFFRGEKDHAGIGSNDYCRLIEFNKGEYEAKGGDRASGIGCGTTGRIDKILINDGEIYSTGGTFGAGIGGGYGANEKGSYVDTIEIRGGNIFSSQIDLPDSFGAGIGGGYGKSKNSSYVNTIKITGGIIEANGGEHGASIGGGYGESEYSSYVKSIILESGSISGIGGLKASAIGGGYGKADKSGYVDLILIGEQSNTKYEDCSNTSVLLKKALSFDVSATRNAFGNGGKNGQVKNLTAIPEYFLCGEGKSCKESYCQIIESEPSLEYTGTNEIELPPSDKFSASEGFTPKATRANVPGKKFTTVASVTKTVSLSWTPVYSNTVSNTIVENEKKSSNSYVISLTLSHSILAISVFQTFFFEILVDIESASKKKKISNSEIIGISCGCCAAFFFLLSIFVFLYKGYRKSQLVCTSENEIEERLGANTKATNGLRYIQSKEEDDMWI